MSIYHITTMTDEFCTSLTPLLQFTPEVRAGHVAAAALKDQRRLQQEPTELDLEILAHDLVRFSPELARQLMELGLAKMEAA
jgi:hypothetical protein